LTDGSVTNGATLTPVSSQYLLAGIGGANDTTNTITLGNAVYAGQELLIVLNSTTTNLVQIADTGNAYLSGNWIGDAGDSISLVAMLAGSNVWVEVGASDN